MGTGYTRADTANNIANGNVIDADDLDNEFNAVEAAFDSSTGHTHDGTSAEGGAILVIGPAQDIVATSSLLRPKSNNVVDLGTSSLKYKDIFAAGDLSLGGDATVTGGLTASAASNFNNDLSVSGTATFSGPLVANGNITLGNAATDTVTFTADIASSLIPSVDDLYDLGAVGSEWRDIYVDGTAYLDTANVTTLSVSGNTTVTGTLTATLTGDVTGDLTGDVTGNADTATALATARTITVAGITSGSASFDGTQNITITTTGLTLSSTAVTATGAELNILDGATLSTAELNTLDGVTATTAELNLLDGVTATTTELNYLDGVTSNVQTQLDAKLSSVDLSSYTGDVDIDGELVVTSYNETFSSVTSSANATTIDCETANVFSHTLTESTTFTFSNPPASGTAYGFALKIIQDASASSYSVTWPSSVDWPEGEQPALTGTASAVDQFVFYTHDGGTTWYGFLAGIDLG